MEKSNSYTKEPMEIKIPVPNGTYEITLTVKAEEDTVFTVFTKSEQIISDEPIRLGETKDFTFTLIVCDEGVEIYILCDKGITATAMLSPLC